MAITKAELLSTLKKARQTQDTRNNGKFVAQVAGKGLSTNDYTDDEQTKLGGIAAGAQVNVLEGVKVNGTAIAATDKEVDITVPTKVSDLTNDADYATKDDVATAASKVYRFKGSVATYADLPTDAVTGDVYNVETADKAHGVNAGDNLVKTDDGWDNLAGTVDLSGYVEKETGKGLSEANFTSEEKTQLANLEAAKDEKVTDEEIAAIFVD